MKINKWAVDNAIGARGEDELSLANENVPINLI